MKLDLDALEALPSQKIILETYPDGSMLTQTSSNAAMKALKALPALIARVRELEGENAALRDITVGQRLSMPPKPIKAFEMLQQEPQP